MGQRGRKSRCEQHPKKKFKKNFKKNFKKLTSYLLSACKNIFKKKT